MWELITKDIYEREGGKMDEQFLNWICPKCGHQNRFGDTYCIICGGERPPK